MKINEVFEKLIENPKDVYQCHYGKWRQELSCRSGFFYAEVFNNNGEKVDSSLGGGGFSGNIRTTDDWELKREPVTFMEAFEAWRKGKAITIDRSDPKAWTCPSVGTYQKDHGNCDNPWWHANDIIHGKWFIND